jgi:hypothetical protein
MDAYRVETVLKQDGTLQLSGLPWQAGAPVEVIVLGQSSPSRSGNSYPLRGTPVTYVNPFEPVEEEQWDAEQ